MKTGPYLNNRFLTMPNKFPKLSFGDVEPLAFVEFWSKFYAYPQEQLYSERIEKNELNADDIERLFKWKNGRNLSQKKEASLQGNVIEKLEVINRLKSNFDIDTFKREFQQVSAIWKIFLLHAIAPQKYPIFDQHVYRAYYFLRYNTLKEIPSYNPKKEKIYFEEYVPFFDSLSNENGLPRKKLDEALWLFGRFLKTEYGKALTEA